MRKVASRQRHQCHHLRRDDLRWLLWGWQGLLPGWLRRTPHDRNRGSMDPDWYCVCGLQLCQAGSTRHLPPSVTYLRLGIVLSQQLGTAYPLLPTRGWQTHPTRKHASYRAVIQRLKKLAVSLDVTLPTFPTNYPQELLVSFVMCLYGNQDELCKKGKNVAFDSWSHKSTSDSNWFAISSCWNQECLCVEVLKAEEKWYITQNKIASRHFKSNWVMW